MLKVHLNFTVKISLMKNLLTLIFCISTIMSSAQDIEIKGILTDDLGDPVIYANLALYNSQDSMLVKVETSDENGAFTIAGISKSSYYLTATYIGFNDLTVTDIDLGSQNIRDLGELIMTTSSVELETAIVTARRSMVEVKPDRTVFNVQGTINSTGDNGLELLRKAPGVLVDNNNNVTVLSRTGVLIYVDGKRLPLTGDDLANYLQNLSADQIDRIDIITNPGAKYEAQGNAGIIDIRLKRNENHGLNGSVSMTSAKAAFWRNGLNGSLNFRNNLLNTYAQLGGYDNKIQQKYYFQDAVNNVYIDNIATDITDEKGINLRWGTDFFLSKNHTLGFLVSGNLRDQTLTSTSDNVISSLSNISEVDSFLVASNDGLRDFDNQNININYVFNKNESTLNIDADYGHFGTDAKFEQPNDYLSPVDSSLLTRVNTSYQTPVDIDILTFKVDYETNLAGGRFGIGSKFSKVSTDNTFRFYDIPDTEEVLNDRRSNQFLYDENVLAGYVSYARTINDKWNFSTGLRLEQTDATGDLIPFAEDLQEDPVELNYLSVFPSAGLTFTLNPQNVFSLNYGRRINRPDYNVLNPFRAQINELSFSKGNPFLSPEIVNNFELGYLWQFRYNFKLAYSRTTDQITRLIGPDDSDPRARFINWDNLAVQTTYSFNASLPVQVTDKWNAFFNLTGSYLDNQADYGDGVIVDLQAWTYNIFQQHTITLPKGFTGEVSGWFSGPGIWGGVFKYDTSWALNLGLQKRFLDDKLNVKISAQDIFRQAFWSGFSEFNGLRSTGMGDWDSQKITLSMSYNFGNQKVKSRNRSTGLEDEADRAQ